MDESKMAFLQSVLRYSTSHSEPISNETAQREMSPERQQWLEGALNNMSVNPIDEIKKCFKILQEETDSEKRLEALELLKDWCEDLNFAIDFHKLNGYSLFEKLLNDSNSEMRALACDLVGTLAQNNPYCQDTLLSYNMLPLMLNKLDQDTNEVKIKALFAISCLARDYEPGQKALLEGNGLDILIRTVKTPVEKLQIKCCFLFASICNNKQIKAQLTQKHLIQILIDMYRNSELNIHEHILSAINILIDDNPNAIKHAKEMKEVNFKQILIDRLDTIAGDPRFDVSLRNLS